MKIKIKKLMREITKFIIILLPSMLIIGSKYYATEYPKQDFDQIIYYLFNGIEGTSSSVVTTVIQTCLLPSVILAAILYILKIDNIKEKVYLKIRIRKAERKIQLYPIKVITKHKKIYILAIYIISILFAIHCFKVDQYFKNEVQQTEIYEQCYVEGQNKKIELPEKKRNLIIIIAESMENTVMSKENGGAWDYSIVPELEQLALENTNFSHTQSVGGAQQTGNSSFSAGGIIAQTAGTPLMTSSILKNTNEYKGSGNFMVGAYALGDILKREGYNLEVMMGSDSNFGGRAQYFNTHGQYKMFDYNYALETGKMKAGEKVWWGFEDDKLYEWSKEEILNLASQNKPFNYIMINADTHFVDGYLSDKAEKKFDKQYENVHAYSSKSMYEFVEWVKEQEFYENTTIVIIGDHLGMQYEFYNEKMDPSYVRTIYNVIINPAIEAKNNKNRIFTSFDMYPTILASIGAKIEGERLGFGTNLYSGIQTYAEELGFTYFDLETRKSSKYYNKNILKDDYYEMKRQAQEEENMISQTN